MHPTIGKSFKNLLEEGIYITTRNFVKNLGGFPNTTSVLG